MGRRDLPNPRAPAHRDAPFLDPVDDVGQHPRLDRPIEPFAEVHQRHRRPGAPALERGVDAAVPCPDHDHPLMPVGVPLDEVVGDVGKILARNAAGNSDCRNIRSRIPPPAALIGLCVVRAGCTLTRNRPVPAARPRDSLDHVLPGPDVEAVVLRHSAIVNQTVLRVGFSWLAMNGMPPISIRSGVEKNVMLERVALDGGDDRPAVEQHAGYASLLGGDADREPARPRTDDQETRPLQRPSLTLSDLDDLIPPGPHAHVAHRHTRELLQPVQIGARSRGQIGQPSRSAGGLLPAGQHLVRPAAPARAPPPRPASPRSARHPSR